MSVQNNYVCMTPPRQRLSRDPHAERRARMGRPWWAYAPLLRLRSRTQPGCGGHPAARPLSRRHPRNDEGRLGLPRAAFRTLTSE